MPENPINEQNICVPDLGEGGQAEVIEILVKSGDSIEANDVLIVLESDKATLEIPCEASGRVRSITVKLGDTVSNGDLIAVMSLTGQNNLKDGGEKVGNKEEKKSEPAQDKEDKAIPKQTKSTEGIINNNKARDLAESSAKHAVLSNTTHSNTVHSTSETQQKNQNVHAGPAARRLARELGVDLSLVQASGPRERILKDDIKSFVKQHLNRTQVNQAQAELPDIDFSKFGTIKLEPLSRINKLSAKNLHRAWSVIPHVTHFDETDITDLEHFRKEKGGALKEKNIKLTLLAFLVKTSAQALIEYPRFNASLTKDGEHLVMKQYVHVGVAVDTDQGLVVPVIKHADQKSILEIAQELGELSEKARNKKLSPGEMQGACFSISSLGGIGGTAFTPIVNWPEVAILGVARAQIKPVYDGGDFQPRLVLPLSLSYDHRVIDGAQAARFCRYLSETLNSDLLRTV